MLSRLFKKSSYCALRTLLIFLGTLLAIGAYSKGQPPGDAMPSEDSADRRSSAATGPDVRHFGYTSEVLDVVEGAGCGYRAPGMVFDSSLFASSADGVIRVGRKIEILKLTREGRANDSTSELTYENAAYRVSVRTQLDSVMEGGVAEHGEMTVEDKKHGGKTRLSIVGGCGC